MLSKSAEQTRAYAKALRYKELDILKSRKGEPNPDDCQSLIMFVKGFLKFKLILFLKFI